MLEVFGFMEWGGKFYDEVKDFLFLREVVFIVLILGKRNERKWWFCYSFYSFLLEGSRDLY